MKSFAFLLLSFIGQDVTTVAQPDIVHDETNPSTQILNQMPHQDRRSRNDEMQNGTGSPSHHPITNENIHHAVKEWMNDRQSTVAKFGHIRHWDVSRVSNMSHLFSWTRSNSLAQFRDNITAWDTSKVTDMSNIFYGNSAMNLDLGNWNVSQVEDMSFAFANTKHYEGHGLVSWDTSKVVNASSMFHQAYAFNSHAVCRWDVRSLVDASHMFQSAKSFQGSNSWRWNSHKLRDMSEMFAHTIVFDGDLSDMDVSSVTDMKGAFFKAAQFNADLAKWKTDKVKDMNSMFAYALSFRGLGLEGWNVSNVSIMANMMKRTAFDRDVSNWDVESVTDMRNMFRYTPSMEQELCWKLHDHANVEGIFFQSQGHFDRSCVSHKFVVQSCCPPEIDNACRCGEVTINEDQEVDIVSNTNADDTHAASKSQSASASDSMRGPFLDKTQYLTATAVASMALLILAIQKFRRCTTLTTTTIDCGEVDDLDISDLDIPCGSLPCPGGSERSLARNNFNQPSDDRMPFEDIPIREII